jgi:hypothetical protein
MFIEQFPDPLSSVQCSSTLCWLRLNQPNFWFTDLLAANHMVFAFITLPFPEKPASVLVKTLVPIISQHKKPHSEDRQASIRVKRGAEDMNCPCEVSVRIPTLSTTGSRSAMVTL